MEKLLILFTFILVSLSTLSFSTSITTSKDQTPCTMCYSCENPCQPLPSPPPPPVIVCPPPPPPPSPPPPAGPQCPPPPKLQPWTPDTGVIGGAYYPPPIGGVFSPPNPVVPYFPYDYNPPAQPSSDNSNSVTLKLKLVVPSIFLFLTMLCFF